LTTWFFRKTATKFWIFWPSSASMSPISGLFKTCRNPSQSGCSPTSEITLAHCPRWWSPARKLIKPTAGKLNIKSCKISQKQITMDVTAWMESTAETEWWKKRQKIRFGNEFVIFSAILTCFFYADLKHFASSDEGRWKTVARMTEDEWIPTDRPSLPECRQCLHTTKRNHHNRHHLHLQPKLRFLHLLLSNRTRSKVIVQRIQATWSTIYQYTVPKNADSSSSNSNIYIYSIYL